MYGYELQPRQRIFSRMNYNLRRVWNEAYKWARIFLRKIQAKDKQKDLVKQKQLYFINAVMQS